MKSYTTATRNMDGFDDLPPRVRDILKNGVSTINDLAWLRRLLAHYGEDAVVEVLADYTSHVTAESAMEETPPAMQP